MFINCRFSEEYKMEQMFRNSEAINNVRDTKTFERQLFEI